MHDAAPVIDPLGSPASVPGFAVGHAEHPAEPTGVSVVLCPPGCTGSLAVMGSAAGTRQTDALAPGHLVQQVHAVAFCGGSAFGLEAAGGVAAWLEERGRGLALGPFTVPIVPAAVIFDLPLSGGRGRPDAALGRAACENAGFGPMARGSRGAGAGATVGKLFGPAQAMKGGVGGASLALDGLAVGALAVVNAFGDVVDADGRILAGARAAPDSLEPAGTAARYLAGQRREAFQPAQSTTLGLVATNAALDKAACHKLAQLAHHGLVRSIQPVHTSFDGDLVIVLAAGEQKADPNGLGVMAAHLLALAVRDAATAARGLPGLPAARDLIGANPSQPRKD
jgi:L-aminopeptidase/D-esterase-like protein